jgi:hypothetical protein
MPITSQTSLEMSHSQLIVCLCYTHGLRDQQGRYTPVVPRQRTTKDAFSECVGNRPNYRGAQKLSYPSSVVMGVGRVSQCPCKLCI